VTFGSFKSCSLKCDSRSFKSEWNVLTYHGDMLAEPVTHRICDPEVAGLITGRGDAVQRLWTTWLFGDDAAFYRITLISCLQCFDTVGWGHLSSKRAVWFISRGSVVEQVEKEQAWMQVLPQHPYSSAPSIWTENFVLIAMWNGLMHVITLDFCISVAHFATVIAAYCWVYDWISVISASSDSGQYVIVRVVLHLLFMNCSCVNW